MSPDELRRKVREEVARVWPGVEVTTRESEAIPGVVEYTAIVPVAAQASARLQREPDEVDVVMIALSLKAGLSHEIAQRSAMAQAFEEAQR